MVLQDPETPKIVQYECCRLGRKMNKIAPKGVQTIILPKDAALWVEEADKFYQRQEQQERERVQKKLKHDLVSQKLMKRLQLFKENQYETIGYALCYPTLKMFIYSLEESKFIPNGFYKGDSLEEAKVLLFQWLKKRLEEFFHDKYASEEVRDECRWLGDDLFRRPPGTQEITFPKEDKISPPTSDDILDDLKSFNDEVIWELQHLFQIKDFETFSPSLGRLNTSIAEFFHLLDVDEVSKHKSSQDLKEYLKKLFNDENASEATRDQCRTLIKDMKFGILYASDQIPFPKEEFFFAKENFFKEREHAQRSKEIMEALQTLESQFCPRLERALQADNFEFFKIILGGAGIPETIYLQKSFEEAKLSVFQWGGERLNALYRNTQSLLGKFYNEEEDRHYIIFRQECQKLANRLNRYVPPNTERITFSEEKAAEERERIQKSNKIMEALQILESKECSKIEAALQVQSLAKFNSILAASGVLHIEETLSEAKSEVFKWIKQRLEKLYDDPAASNAAREKCCQLAGRLNKSDRLHSKKIAFSSLEQYKMERREKFKIFKNYTFPGLENLLQAETFEEFNLRLKNPRIKGKYAYWKKTLEESKLAVFQEVRKNLRDFYIERGVGNHSPIILQETYLLERRLSQYTPKGMHKFLFLKAAEKQEKNYDSYRPEFTFSKKEHESFQEKERAKSQMMKSDNDEILSDVADSLQKLFLGGKVLTRTINGQIVNFFSGQILVHSHG